MVSNKLKLVLPSIAGAIVVLVCGAVSGFIPCIGNVCCFLYVPLGGACGAWIAKKAFKNGEVEPLDGGIVGGLSGLFGSLLNLVSTVVLAMFLGTVYLSMGAAFAAFARNLIPGAILGGLGLGFTALLVIGAIVQVCGFTLLGAVGGYLAASSWQPAKASKQ